METQDYKADCLLPLASRRLVYISDYAVSAVYMVVESRRQSRYCQLHCISMQLYNCS